MSVSLRLWPRHNNQHETTHHPWCIATAVLVMVLPVLAWPVMDMFVIGGCVGGLHIGLTCPRIEGLNFYSIPTDLLHFSVKGFVYSLPIGAILLALCHFVHGRHAK